MELDKETIEENKRANTRIMRQMWARRSERSDLSDPVVLVFEAEDQLGGELAELVRYPEDEGMVISLISADVIARALEDYDPEACSIIRTADRSRPLAVLASFQHGVTLVYLDEVHDTH